MKEQESGIRIFTAFRNTYSENISRMFACALSKEASRVGKVIKTTLCLLFLPPLLLTALVFSVMIILDYLSHFFEILLRHLFGFLEKIKNGIDKDILGYIFSPIIIALGLPFILIIVFIPKFGTEIEESVLMQNTRLVIKWHSVSTFKKVKDFYIEAINLLHYRNDRPMLERFFLQLIFFIPNVSILLIALMASTIIIPLDAISIIVELFRMKLLLFTKRLSDNMCKDDIRFIFNNSAIIITAPFFLFFLIFPKISSLTPE